MMNWNDPKILFALETVQQAACLAADIQQEMVTETLTKQDRSPVTVADFAAQALAGYFLNQAFPGALLVGEEAADALRSPVQRRTLESVAAYVRRVIPGVSLGEVCELIDRGVDDPGDSYWTLDPIDGTKGFLRKAQYACALAYVEGGRVQLGLLGCPNLAPDLQEDIGGEGSLLIASRGGGSWITALRADLSPEAFSALSVSGRSDPVKAQLLRSFESGHTNSSQMDSFQESLGGKEEPVRMDSQVKYALLAAGRADIYLRLLSPERQDYREKIWDQAAGSIIVEEAGGKVTDLDGKELDFSRGRSLMMNRGICASNGVLHQDALAALREIDA